MWVVWLATADITTGRIPLFYERDDAFLSYVRELMEDKASARDEFADELDKVWYMFSHIILSNSNLSVEFEYSPLREVECQNGFKLYVREPAEDVILIVGVSPDSAGCSSTAVERRLEMLLSILTFLYGPAYDFHLSRKATLTQRRQNWNTISLLLNKWHELFNTEQCFLVEAIEEIATDTTYGERGGRQGDAMEDKVDALLNEARKVVKQKLGCTYDYVIHTMLAVESKIVQFHSSEKDRPLSSYDMLLMLLASLSYFPSHLMPEDLFSQARRAGSPVTIASEDSDDGIRTDTAELGVVASGDRYFTCVLLDEDIITEPSDSQSISLLSSEGSISARESDMSTKHVDFLIGEGKLPNSKKLSPDAKFLARRGSGSAVGISSSLKISKSSPQPSEHSQQLSSQQSDEASLEVVSQSDGHRGSSQREAVVGSNSSEIPTGVSSPSVSVGDERGGEISFPEDVVTVTSDVVDVPVPHHLHSVDGKSQGQDLSAKMKCEAKNSEKLQGESGVKAPLNLQSSKNTSKDSTEEGNHAPNVDITLDSGAHTEKELTGSDTIKVDEGDREITRIHGSADNLDSDKSFDFTSMSSSGTIKASRTNSLDVDQIREDIAFKPIEPSESTGDVEGNSVANVDNTVGEETQQSEPISADICGGSPGETSIRTRSVTSDSSRRSTSLSSVQSQGEYGSPSADSVHSIKSSSKFTPRVTSRGVRKMPSMPSVPSRHRSADAQRRRHQSLTDRASDSTGHFSDEYFSAATPPFSPISHHRRPSVDSDTSYHTAAQVRSGPDYPLDPARLLRSVLGREDNKHYFKELFIHKRVFLKSSLCDHVPACLYLISVAPGINIIVAAEIVDPQKPGKLVDLIGQLTTLLHPAKFDKTNSPDRFIERIADKLRDCVELIKLRVHDVSYQQQLDGMSTIWRRVVTPLKKCYREEAKSIPYHLRKNILSICDQLKRAFRTLYMPVTDLAEDAVDQMQRLQLYANRKLRFYKPILLVKANRNMAMSAFQNDKYPGLVHFVYVYRNRNTLKSPSIQLSVEDDSLEAQVVRDMKGRMWRILPWIYKQLTNGYTSISVKDGDFIFTFDLLVYDEVHYRSLPRMISQPTLYNPPKVTIGDLKGQFYKQLLKLTDAGAGLKCLELLTVHFAVVPRETISKQRTLLLQNELHKKHDPFSIY